MFVIMELVAMDVVLLAALEVMVLIVGVVVLVVWSCTSPLCVLPVAAACKHCLVTPKGECGRPSRVINVKKEEE